MAAITWGIEDLTSQVGALSKREEDGRLSPSLELAGALCLLAAAAAGIPAIDTIYSDFRDSAGFAADCRASRRRGFRGRLAIYPDQVAVINEAYAPTEVELVLAKQVVAAFASQPRSGAISIDGVMYDRPHLLQAQRLLGV